MPELVIRHADTRCFLSWDGRWTIELDRARRFPSYQAAVDSAHELAEDAQNLQFIAADDAPTLPSDSSPAS